MITWRKYQSDAIEKVFDAWNKYRRILGVAATGAGKTQIFWGVVDRFITENPSARILIVAHREELITQPKERVEKFFPHLRNKVGIVMGAAHNECHRQILIGTIQTVGGRSKKRLEEIQRYGKIDLLIIDEAHHAEAPQYFGLWRALMAANPDLKVLGVTATPERGDRKLLTKIFEHEVFNIGVRSLIDEGHLCEPIFHGIKTKVDLSKLKVNGSGGKRDYKLDGLVSAFETKDVFDHVVKTHLENCGDRPTVIFTVSVNGAIRLTERLKAAGVKAVCIYSARKAKKKTTIEDIVKAFVSPDLPDEDQAIDPIDDLEEDIEALRRDETGSEAKARRKDALDGMKSGKYTCLVNVMIATEGFDLPALEFLHIVRPTKSDGLWIQMVGRVLRTSPETGKTVATIFDYLPKDERNFEQRMLIYKKPKRKREMPEGAAEGGGGGKEARPDSTGEVELVLLDYFNRREEAWLQTNDGWRCIQLGKGVDPKSGRKVERGLALSPDGIQLWAIWRFCGDRMLGILGDRWAKAKVLSSGDAHENLQRISEFTQAYGDKIIMNRSAAWRNRVPSPGLVQWGRSLKVYREGMNQGQLSDAINNKIIMRAVYKGQKDAAEAEKEALQAENELVLEF